MSNAYILNGGGEGSCSLNISMCTPYTKRADFINKKIGKMLILELVGSRRVKCLCDCGKIKECDWQHLKCQKIIGCGCQRHTPELNEESRKRTTEMVKSGVLNKGGDQYSTTDRSFRYFLKLINRSYRKECLITVEDLREVWESQNGICPYSKLALALPTHSNPNPEVPFKMASVDRIDSSKPYTRDNIQFVSRNMNYAKHSLSHEQMLEFLRLIKG